MNKTAVAKAFSQAATQYDQAAHLQREVADRLLNVTIANTPNKFDTLVDLGTGTGYCLPKLNAQFQPDTLYALDLSASMLKEALKKQPNATTIVGDLEAPPLPANSIDLAFSSLAVQWLDSPDTFIHNIVCALKPNGFLAVATLGPQTLIELKTAWANVDDADHVNTFTPLSDWQHALNRPDIHVRHCAVLTLTRTYSTPLTLLQELKALGANHISGQSSSRPASVRRMIREYPTLENGQYPASWDVHFIIAQKTNEPDELSL